DRDDPRRLPRPCAPQLDSQLRSIRPRRRAGGAGARDRRATGRSHREVCLMICSAKASARRGGMLMLALALLASPALAQTKAIRTGTANTPSGPVANAVIIVENDR